MTIFTLARRIIPISYDSGESGKMMFNVPYSGEFFMHLIFRISFYPIPLPWEWVVPYELSINTLPHYISKYGVNESRKSTNLISIYCPAAKTALEDRHATIGKISLLISQYLKEFHSGNPPCFIQKPIFLSWNYVGLYPMTGLIAFKRLPHTVSFFLRVGSISLD